MALAEVRSIPAASKELEIPIDTITRWVEEEPETPALQRAVELALSELTARIADGSIRGRDLTVAYGVLRDKWARYGTAEARSAAGGSGSAVAAREEFHDWLVETVAESLDESKETLSEEALAANVDAIDSVRTDLLLRRANAEADPYGPPSLHRVAILAWFSNRPEVEAGDVVEWAQDQVREVIETHGSLVAWHAFQQAEDAAEETRREEEIAGIEARAAASRAEADQAIHHAEAMARVVAAELSRRST